MALDPSPDKAFDRTFAREMMILEARHRQSEPDALGPHLAAERTAYRVMMVLGVLAACAVVLLVALVR
ncbi:MAG: hypothetical protein NW216_02370 [Hyphomicrobium sp.]|nr:hypothetical protein [Hyphomicrobium sp.]